MPVTSMDGEPRRTVVTAVLRALRLLELFEPGRPEMSLSELMRRASAGRRDALAAVPAPRLRERRFPGGHGRVGTERSPGRPAARRGRVHEARARARRRPERPRAGGWDVPPRPPRAGR